MLKFNTSGVRQWSTYYGGTSSDEGLTVHSDGTNVFLLGRTSSTNLPLLNPGGGAYYQSTNGGSGDVLS
ncbi:hypothetical protein JYU20_01160 [Bacteroidales bacterium AH-315-I05]|nr:hypothetical protein [Bacteroidales bacterium AH-315-I05]